MKIINMNKKISGTTKRKAFTLLVLLVSVGMMYGQAAHPGTEEGLPTPIDGGILMALLAGGGLISMLLKKKKSKNIE
jgi:hypothetical protein